MNVYLNQPLEYDITLWIRVILSEQNIHSFVMSQRN